MNNQTLSLSAKKFTNLLSKRSYVLETLYCESIEGKTVCRFAECKSPQYQKLFMVYIPEKYFMNIEELKNKKLYIRKDDKSVPSLKKEFLTEIKGNAPCSLLMKSSLFLTTYINEDYDTYEITTEPPVVEEDVIEDEEIEKDEETISSSEDEDEVDDIEKEIETISKTVGSEEQQEKKSSEKVAITKKTKKSMEVVKPKSKKGGVELVFEDTIDSDVKEFIDAKEMDEMSNGDVKDMEFQQTSDDDENPATSGIVCIVFQIGDLHKKFNSQVDFEKELLDLIDQIDQNDRELRKLNLEKINSICITVVKHCTTRLKEIEEKEKHVKEQIIRLSKAIEKVDSLLEKSKINPKLKDSIGSVESMCGKIRKTMHEFNMESLRLKDEANALLLMTKGTLNDLLEA